MIMSSTLKHISVIGLIVVLFLCFGASYLFAEDETDRLISETQKSIEQFDDVFEGLMRERDALREDMEKFRKEQQRLISDARREAEGTEEETAGYKRILDSTGEKVDDLQAEKQFLSGELNDLKVRVSDLTADSKDKDRTLADLEIQHSQLIDQLNDAERSLLKASQKINDLEEEKMSLARELEEVLKNYKKLSENDNPDKGSRAKENTISDIDKNLASSQEKADVLIEFQRAQIERLKSEEERLKREISGLDKNGAVRRKGYAADFKKAEGRASFFTPGNENFEPEQEERIKLAFIELKKTQEELNLEREKNKVINMEAEKNRNALKKLRMQMAKRDEKFKLAKDSIEALEESVDSLRQNIASQKSFHPAPAKKRKEVNLSGKETAGQDVNDAILLFDRGKYKEALVVFNNVLISDPDNRLAHYYMGIIYSKYIKERDRAAEHFMNSLGEF